MYIDKNAFLLASWTLEKLTDKNKEKVTELTIFENYKKIVKFNETEISFSHSNPFGPFSMHYIKDIENARDFCLKTDFVKSKFNFVGHSHIPQVYDKNKEGRVRNSDHRGGIYDLSECEQALVVVPGAGQPRENLYRNEKKKTGYAIFDTDSQKLEIIRLDYDWDKMIKGIKEKMPAYFDYHKDKNYFRIIIFYKFLFLKC